MNTHLYEEIRSIEDIINEKKNKVNDNISTEDEYTRLMKKEDAVLNILDDMKKQKDNNDDVKNYFTTAPIHVIIFKTFNTIMRIINEVSNQDDLYQVVDLFLKKDNLIYVGIAFVIFSFLLMFISL
tara:strand:+ start:1863 stop:2240 length:378 start_codon:yes stop_codon:yes gene_type:complete